jgi:hypothetical protein
MSLILNSLEPNGTRFPFEISDPEDIKKWKKLSKSVDDYIRDHNDMDDSMSTSDADMGFTIDTNMNGSTLTKLIQVMRQNYKDKEIPDEDKYNLDITKYLDPDTQHLLDLQYTDRDPSCTILSLLHGAGELEIPHIQDICFGLIAHHLKTKPLPKIQTFFQLDQRELTPQEDQKITTEYPWIEDVPQPKPIPQVQQPVAPNPIPQVQQPVAPTPSRKRPAS